MELIVAFLAGVIVASVYWGRHYYRVSNMLDESIGLTRRAIAVADEAADIADPGHARQW